MEDYRRFAAECVSMAERVRDPHYKLILIDMAAVWVRLADRLEKSTRAHFVGETSSPSQHRT